MSNNEIQCFINRGSSSFSSLLGPDHYVCYHLICCCVRLALSISFVCKQECLSFVLHNDNKSLCTGPDGIAWSSIRNVYSPFSEMRKCKSFPCREKLQLTTSPSWSGGGHNNQVRAESSFNLTANNSVGRC